MALLCSLLILHLYCFGGLDLSVETTVIAQILWERFPSNLTLQSFGTKVIPGCKSLWLKWFLEVR